MLVLSRKVGERIHVGDDIMVEVRRIAGNRVTLALAAPRDVRILRGELAQAAREFDAPATSSNGRVVCLSITNEIDHFVADLPAESLERDFAI